MTTYNALNNTINFGRKEKKMEKQTWFDVTVLSPFTGREETHCNVPRESLFLNEHCEIMIQIYDEPTPVLMTQEVTPPTAEQVTGNGQFGCE